MTKELIPYTIDEIYQLKGADRLIALGRYHKHLEKQRKQDIKDIDRLGSNLNAQISRLKKKALAKGIELDIPLCYVDNHKLYKKPKGE